MTSKEDDLKVDQSASPRQWFGLVLVYLLIPLVLLICGGDLSWWQSWLYSSLVVVVGIGGRIWAEQRQPGLAAGEAQRLELQRPVLHLELRRDQCALDLLLRFVLVELSRITSRDHGLRTRAVEMGLVGLGQSEIDHLSFSIAAAAGRRPAIIEGSAGAHPSAPHRAPRSQR